MKRLLVIALLAISFTIIGCGNKEAAEVSEENIDVVPMFNMYFLWYNYPII